MWKNLQLVRKSKTHLGILISMTVLNVTTKIFWCIFLHRTKQTKGDGWVPAEPTTTIYRVCLYVCVCILPNEPFFVLNSSGNSILQPLPDVTLESVRLVTLDAKDLGAPNHWKWESLPSLDGLPFEGSPRCLLAPPPPRYLRSQPGGSATRKAISCYMAV